MNINTYTELQLQEITNNYDTPIGRGAFGKVYRGTTHENLRVAVKRSIIEGVKPPEDNDLVNEIATQFEIRHANVVRLVGCCLETDVPMLVFEYVSNGSLHSVLHGSTPRPLPLSVRLDIAIGSAKALAYMHSHGGRSLVHGDVKSGNILLGDHFTPKVSDFGSSKLESIARYRSFCVKADSSYIDPVYTKTGRFTQKSDVYSFGVVLLELITRKMARYGNNNNNSLPVEFVKSYVEDGNGRKMYDKDIIFSDGEAQSHRYVECLDQIGMLAVRCLKEDKDERPSMAEVVEELMQVKLRSCSDTSCGTN
jgi:serine/threonine protein kinase